MPTRLKVSVCIQTYNHEDYIAKAIDSVLSQQTDFEFEVRIGEDDSTDRTRDIVRDYANTHQHVTALLRDSKNKIYIDGRPTGRFNFLDNIQGATGEYIALLDGDDYWIDDRKLQKQVELLDASPNASICFHRIYDERPDGTRTLYPRQSRCKKSVYGLSDLLIGNFIPTASVMFRNREFHFPAWLYEVPFADWPLHVLNAERGEIRFIDQAMAVRRDHGAGMWSGLKETERDFQNLRLLRELDQHVSAEYRPLVEKQLAYHQQRLIRRTCAHQGLRAALSERMRSNKTIDRELPWTRTLPALASGVIKRMANKMGIG